MHFLCDTVLRTLLQVSKRNVHWVALKHRLNTWTLARFYYVDKCTYCCFYYVAKGTYCGGWEFKYPGSVPKNECSIVLEIYPTPNPTINLPDSANKWKTDIKTCLLMQPCHLNFLICRFELLCWTVITQDLNQSFTLPRYVTYSASYQTNLLLMKTHIYKAGYVRC